jgi:nicotinamidase-related amidase
MSSPIRRNGLRASRLPLSPRALLLVDFINPLDFPGAQQLAAPALAAARATASLKARLADQGVCAIYANDNYGAWQSDFRALVARCQAMDGEAGEIARLLAPGERDLTILKPRHSAFYGSPLELLLAEMETGELVVCGLATDMCVQMTVADAFLREFKTWVPADCTAAETPRATQDSLAYMASVLKADVHPSA